MAFVGETLKTFSINPRAESIRLNQLNGPERQWVFWQNLEAYTNEVVADKPVSILYHYWVDGQGEIFTDPSFKPVFNLSLQLDERERGGMAREGIRRAVDLARINPGQMVGLYSPPGPASFDQDSSNPYTQITYSYGQFYLMSSDGAKINAIAIKISKEGEPWVADMMPATFHERSYAEDDPKEIAILIQNPVLLIDLNSSTNKLESSNPIVYKGRDKTFYLDEVLRQIHNTFTGLSKPTINYYDKTLYALEEYEVTKEAILQAYLTVIQQYMQINGLHSVELMGSCGGNQATSLIEIEEILGISHNLFDNPFAKLLSGLSSIYRELIQNSDNNGNYDYHDGICDKCKRQAKIGPCNYCKQCE